ncbi:hypothetical protein [Lentzea sp. CA-135723]|uniref:hypothetical protein n=1 Tax=Lentzea sp. CA-135723 TaxID=3239950 RepID=UPI003D918512
MYVSGDNASLDEVKKIAERFAPVDTAILFAGAPRFPVLFDNECIVLDSAQAAEAARLLEARADLEAAFGAEGLAGRLDWGR